MALRQRRVGKHLVIVDQPVPAGRADAGPAPLEVQLMALGGGIVASGGIIANQRKLADRGIEVSVEGEIDPDGLLGKPSEKRDGFSAITAHVKNDADVSAAEKEQFLHDIDVRGPI